MIGLDVSAKRKPLLNNSATLKSDVVVAPDVLKPKSVSQTLVKGEMSGVMAKDMAFYVEFEDERVGARKAEQTDEIDLVAEVKIVAIRPYRADCLHKIGVWRDNERVVLKRGQERWIRCLGYLALLPCLVGWAELVSRANRFRRALIQRA